jgi:asparagine synthase (glutamine-hydrolysing)
MSAQLGLWYFDGRPVAEEHLARASSALAAYGPDKEGRYSKAGTTILYRAFHTTKESHFEVQPHTSSQGDIITWDGRLDNRKQLIQQLKGRLTAESPDVAVVAVAHEEWGNKCFARFMGDWAVSIWKPRHRSLLLAKDPVGTRHLYYSTERDRVTWSTILDPLVQLPGKRFEICNEYVAGWLSYFPAAYLTPYVGILAVEPSSIVILQLDDTCLKQINTKYWDFNPHNRILCNSDTEYQEQFLCLFAKAVERRLRSDRPILCELSGGIDSSSIVCVADNILARGRGECPRVDTISWFDDTYDHLEPDSNELHWITKVENKRSRSGYHLNCGEISAESDHAYETFVADFASKFQPIPEPIGQHTAFINQYAACLGIEHRVTLSGVGGSEFTGGGVPTPVLELQDLISRAHFLKFVRKMEAWSLKTRQKKSSMLWGVIRGFLPLEFAQPPNEALPLPWLNSEFVDQNRLALQGYPVSTKLSTQLPSFQDYISTMNAVRRLLASCRLRPDLLREARFPYLDTELLEFLLAIPREQIVGVGRRRHLVRRAFRHVVPEEILNRKRKPFPHAERSRDCTQLFEAFRKIRCMVSNSLGFVDVRRLQQTLQRLEGGEQTYFDALHKTLSLELWLQHMVSAGIINTTSSLDQELLRFASQMRYGCHSSVSSEAKRPSFPVMDEISAG